MLSSNAFTLLAVALSAYLIGGLPFGYWFVRLTSGQDIRSVGSGNIGATNVHRAAGKKAGLIVLLLDICKGFLAVWLAGKIGGPDGLPFALGTVAVLLGHCFPVFLRFKGGKAVACFVGAFLFLAPVALALTAALFFLTVRLTRFISLGSLVGAAFFPLFYWLIYRPAPALLTASILSGLLIVFRHRANIERLRTGKESVFSLKGGAA